MSEEPVPEIHINCDADITPEKREILGKMFGHLYMQEVEEIRRKRRALRAARKTPPNDTIPNKH